MAFANPWGITSQTELELFHHITRRRFTTYDSCIEFLYSQREEPEDPLHVLKVYICRIRKASGARFRSIYTRGYEWLEEGERRSFKKQLDELFDHYKAPIPLDAVRTPWSAYIWPRWTSWDLGG